jgi:dihydropteroate synthase
MGALNVSPESFYAGSIHRDDHALLRAAQAMVEAGARLVDVGARSTAPYLPTGITEDEERERIARAVALLAGKLAVPVCADTARPGPARAALEAGARVLNDVTGLADPRVARLAAEHEASVILMASPDTLGGEPMGDPLQTVRRALDAALARARTAGIPDERIVLDPGIGFFRDAAIPWDAWDARVLARLGELRDLGRPVGVGVSRKSFVGAITGRSWPEDRLPGSLAAAAVAVLEGAALVRTHDVAETLDAVRVAERLREARGT